jgi:fumarate reductase flavoprotein subunit
MMKKQLRMALAFLLAVSLCACGSQATMETISNSETGSTFASDMYIPGTYTASQYGMESELKVTIEFDENKILDVQIEGSETEGYGSRAIDEMPAQILAAQSANVDGVSGATVTSTAIRTAAANCIAQAKGDVPVDEDDKIAETEADVIVVGAGASGLAAAAAAAENGASVILLEANGRVGGSASTSGGHLTMINEEMNAAMDRNDSDLEVYLSYNPDEFGDFAEDLVVLQQQITEYLASDEPGRFDSYERAMVDHYLSGKGTDLDGVAATLDHDLIGLALKANMDINNWLMEEGKMTIKESYYKEHANSPEGGGSGLVEALSNITGQYDTIQLLLNTRATELVQTDGKVTGVIAVDENGNNVVYTANGGVVLATGSFSSNGEMAASYQNIATGLNAENGSTNPATNVGDGILMAEALGAELRDMQFMCTMNFGYNGGCGYVDWSKIVGTQKLIVNAEGVRIGDENSSATAGSIANQPNGMLYLVGDQEMIDALNEVRDGFADELIEAGVLVVGDTLEEVANAVGLNPETLAVTVETFNGYVETGKDEEFGRTEFAGKVENGPYCIAIGEAFYHLTFGGLVINENAQVLDTQGVPIQGLYAAGDLTSGFEGAAHISGDCLTSAIYFGQVGGQNAANEK